MLGLAVLVQCCKPKETCTDPSNPDCENYDPCWGQAPVSAEFEFLAQYGVADNAVWIPETKFVGSPVRFSAKDKNADAYTWYLGVDTISGTDEVELGINNLLYGSYSAALVLEKSPNFVCFPEDDGRDSLMLYFEKVEFCDALNLGKFRGLTTKVSQDSIDIEIQMVHFNTGEICHEASMPRLINVLGNQDTIFTQGGYSTYSRKFFAGNGSGDLRGEIIVDEETWSTTFNYRLGSVDYEFIGRKLE